MKSKLICLLIAFGITNNLHLQVPQNPGIAWRSIKCVPYDFDGTPLVNTNSGEDWWYSLKKYTNPSTSQHEGYVVSGYAGPKLTPSNINYYNTIMDYPNGCANYMESMSSYKCYEMQTPNRIRGILYGPVALLDLDGNIKWSTKTQAFELPEVIQVSDGFVAIGTCYNRNREDGSWIPYNPSDNFDDHFNCSGGFAKKTYVVKTDFEGNIIWDNMYGATLGADNAYGKTGEGFDIIESSNGNLIAVGWCDNNGTDPNAPITEFPAVILILELEPDGRLAQTPRMQYFDAENSENNFANHFYGLNITEIGTTQKYLVSGKIEFIGSTGNDLNRAYTMCIDNNFDAVPTSVWPTNPFIYTAGVDHYNSNVWDVIYHSGLDQIIAPVEANCEWCNAAGDVEADLYIFRLNPDNGQLISSPYFVSEVGAWDVRPGVTETMDGGFAVVSSTHTTFNTFPNQSDFEEVMTLSGFDYDVLVNNDPVTYAQCSDIHYNNAPNEYWNSDALVVKFDNNAVEDWRKVFDASPQPRDMEPFPGDIKRQECLYKIIENDDGSLVIAGNTSHNFDDAYMVKIHDDCQMKATYDENGSGVLHEIPIFSSTSWTSRTVRGVVHIYAPAVLTIDGATIQFADSRRNGYPTKIVVEPGAKLILKNGAVLTSFQGCEKAMWDGVELWGFHTLSQYPETNQGVVEISSNSTIENAGNGISTRAVFTNQYNVNTVNWARTGGGIIRANNANFINCYRGIEMMAYQGYDINSNPVNDRSYILSCSFETNGSYGNNLEIGTPYTFISMWNTRNVRIEGNSFTNARTSLPPDKWGSGIVSMDAGYRVVPRCTSATFPCTASIPNTFNNLFHGIYVIDGANDKVITIDGNTFTNNIYGVRLANTHYSKVVRNTFNIDDIGVPYVQTSFGIYADQAFGSRIENNTMNGIGPLGVNGRTIGTFCSNSNSGTQGFMDYRNNYFNLETGSQAEEQNSNIIINCNQYHGDNVFTTSGIFAASGEIHDLGSCVGDPTTPESNLFLGSCNGTDRFQVYSNPDVLSIDNYPGLWSYHTYNPLPDGPIAGCFLNVIRDPCLNPVPNITSRCPAQYTNSSVENRIYAQSTFTRTTNDISTLKQSIDGGNTQATLDYISGNHSAGQIKNYLIARSPYLSDEVLIAAIEKNLPPAHIKQILIANSDLSIKVLASVSEAGLPSVIYNQVMAAQNGGSAMEDLLNSIQQAETQRTIAASEIVYYFLDTNQVDSAILFLEDSDLPHALCALAPIIGKSDTTSTKAMLEIIENSANEMLSNPETQSKGEDLIDFCTFQKTLLKIQSAEGGYFSMSLEDIDALKILADGNSQISASAAGILQFVQESTFYKGAVDYNFNVPYSLPTNGPIAIEDEKNITMNIYPNPTNEGFSIQLSLVPDASEKTTVYVYDMHGRIISTDNWGSEQDYDWINTETWPGGVYIVSVNINDKFLQYKKVIVAK